MHNALILEYNKCFTIQFIFIPESNMLQAPSRDCYKSYWHNRTQDIKMSDV